MKKIFWITLILCLIIPLCVYAVDGSDCDVDKDGDVDEEDLSAFSEYFGKSRWYKDADGDGYSDGTTVWAVSRPADYCPAGELTTLWGDPDDDDPGTIPPLWYGDYTIEDMNDVAALSGYGGVGGTLRIRSSSYPFCSVPSLKGLELLTWVSGSLQIYQNAALTSLSALDNLTSVGGSLEIVSNAALTSLSGLDNLTSFGGDLIIAANGALTSLSGLDNLTSVGGPLIISGNSALASLSALNNLTSIGGDLYIEYNAALTSLGLGSLCSADDNFEIYNNTSLCENLALDLMDQVLACPSGGIGGTTYISGNTCP